jgi:hypothetical protein
MYGRWSFAGRLRDAQDLGTCLTRVSQFELETMAAFVIPRMKLRAPKKFGLYSSFAQIKKVGVASCVLVLVVDATPCLACNHCHRAQPVLRAVECGHLLLLWGNRTSPRVL